MLLAGIYHTPSRTVNCPTIIEKPTAHGFPGGALPRLASLGCLLTLSPPCHFARAPQVSFGPTIRGAHSPDERVLVSSVQPFFDLTLRVLGKLADRQ